jgi:iron complex transport system ATP-binding protein
MINIQNITASYRDKTVLNSVSLEIEPNEFSCILGPNGAGKSTLLKCINSIKRIDSGDIVIRGKSISTWDNKLLAREIAFIPQEFHLHFDFTVYEFILQARYPWLDFLGRYSDRDYAIVEKYISLLDLQQFRDRYFHQLSGGEKQRILIARALVQDTGIILLDESLSSLDINHQIEILSLLKQIIITEKKGIVMVSHNLNLSAEFAEKLIFLKDGQIVATGAAKDVYTESILSEIFEMKIQMIENPWTGVKNIVVSRLVVSD